MRCGLLARQLMPPLTRRSPRESPRESLERAMQLWCVLVVCCAVLPSLLLLTLPICPLALARVPGPSFFAVAAPRRGPLARARCRRGFDANQGRPPPLPGRADGGHRCAALSTRTATPTHAPSASKSGTHPLLEEMNSGGFTRATILFFFRTLTGWYLLTAQHFFPLSRCPAAGAQMNPLGRRGGGRARNAGLDPRGHSLSSPPALPSSLGTNLSARRTRRETVLAADQLLFTPALSHASLLNLSLHLVYFSCRVLLLMMMMRGPARG